MAARVSASKANKKTEVQSHKHELRTEVQEFKRRRILEQSRELFFAQGYEATTLDTIAAELKVTKPFLYSYFRNKSEILNAICEIGIRAPLAVLDEVLSSKLPPGEKLRLATERLTSKARNAVNSHSTILISPQFRSEACSRGLRCGGGRSVAGRRQTS
jgi:AcrR family transcriptional regulator